MLAGIFNLLSRRTGAIAAGLLAITSPQHACAGAWLLEEGRGQIIFNPTIMSAASRFDRRGAARPADRFSKVESQMTVEYGFRQDLTLILQSVQRTEMFSLNGDPQRVLTTGLGGGFRTPLWRGDNAIVSVQFSAVPMLERGIPVLDRRFGPRIEADARLLAGHGFTIGDWPAFVEAQTAYRWRSGRHADELRFDLTFGIRPLPRLLLLAQAMSSAALQRVADGSGERPRQHKLMVSAVVDVTSTWSLQGGVYASLAGRDALKERGVSMAIWRKF